VSLDIRLRMKTGSKSCIYPKYNKNFSCIIIIWKMETGAALQPCTNLNVFCTGISLKNEMLKEGHLTYRTPTLQ
jgi:hypothetical protein